MAMTTSLSCFEPGAGIVPHQLPTGPRLRESRLGTAR